MNTNSTDSGKSSIVRVISKLFCKYAYEYNAHESALDSRTETSINFFSLDLP